MQQNNQQNSRRKFMVWTASILSGLSLITLGVRGRIKKETVKMLTQDGKLVEVEKDLLTSPKKRISDDGLRNWIKTKKI